MDKGSGASSNYAARKKAYRQQYLNRSYKNTKLAKLGRDHAVNCLFFRRCGRILSLGIFDPTFLLMVTVQTIIVWYTTIMYITWMNELGGVINSNTLQYLQTFSAGTKTRSDLTGLHDYNACNALNLSFCAANLPCADNSTCRQNQCALPLATAP